MRVKCSLVFFLIFIAFNLNAQTNISPCSDGEIMNRHLQQNPNAEQEMLDKEAFIKAFVEERQQERALGISSRSDAEFTIPVVIHVFHNGDSGKVDSAQIMSGLEVLNNDFNGLNNDWNTIDSAFDSIKASIDIEFCLASIDPNGNPTTGVLYYEDSLAMLNIGNLFQHAWDNYSYLNIYMPKYTNGGPSLFTAFAYYPSTFNSDINQDGIFYSSIRWGYGTHSELAPGQEWASVVTHEVGHWLDLRHTFENGCSFIGDFVDDTPPTTGGTIELSGCNNYDFSCGVHTNGENYMDYNHDCKKMFTQGQVDRMLAALHLPSRAPLWSEANLIATGCKPAPSVGIEETKGRFNTLVYPNPSHDVVNFNFEQSAKTFRVTNVQGQLILDRNLDNSKFSFVTEDLEAGLYFYVVTSESGVSSGTFVVK